MKRTVILRGDQQRETLWTYLQGWREAAAAGKPLLVSIDYDYEPPRTDDQNRKMWALLNDVADQVEWHGQRLAAEDFKDMFTAAMRNQRVVPGISGGFVVLGQRTSRMSKRDLSDLIEMIYAFGAERGVEWSDEPAHATPTTGERE